MNVLLFISPPYPIRPEFTIVIFIHYSMADPGGRGGAGGKYFKKSPKLAKIYKKILGASPQNPFSDPESATESTSRELLSQLSTCSGWRWFEVGKKLKKIATCIVKLVSWKFSV